MKAYIVINSDQEILFSSKNKNEFCIFIVNEAIRYINSNRINYFIKRYLPEINRLIEFIDNKQYEEAEEIIYDLNILDYNIHEIELDDEPLSFHENSYKNFRADLQKALKIEVFK